MEKKVNKNSEALGVSGFTLGISGIFVSFFLYPFYGLLFLILALIFSVIQQKKKPTRIGKAALIISIAGIVGTIIWWIALIKIIIPYLVEKMPELF